MKYPLLSIVTVICLSSPALVTAQPLNCGQPASIFMTAGVSPLDLTQLAQSVGTAPLDGQSLRQVTQNLRADYPAATDAEISDVMITAFCTYLNTDAAPDLRNPANIRAFEKDTYDAVFGGPPPDSYQPQGWLYDK